MEKGVFLNRKMINAKCKTEKGVETEKCKMINVKLKKRECFYFATMFTILVIIPKT